MNNILTKEQISQQENTSYPKQNNSSQQKCRKGRKLQPSNAKAKGIIVLAVRHVTAI